MSPSAAHYTAFIIGLSQLVGCATVVPYAPPEKNVAQARIRFVLPGAGHFLHAAVYGREDATCKGSAMFLANIGSYFGIPYDWSKPIDMLSSGTLEPATFVERRIPAGKPYLLNFRIMPGNWVCDVSSSFTPEPDADYQVGMSSRFRECSVIFTRLVRDKDGEVTANIMRDAKRESCSY